MARVSARVPSEFLQRPIRVLRPRDAAAVYAHPRPEIARLTRAGALHRLATGYYAVVPDNRIGHHWLPNLELAALGVAAADDSIDTVALMGLSAARIHGAIPRALAVAVVATSHHRPPLHLSDRDAEVIFAHRNVTRLDVQRHTNELGQGWVTTIEQTVLDLAARPKVGGLPAEADAALRALLPRADRELLRELAADQRRLPTIQRILEGA